MFGSFARVSRLGTRFVHSHVRRDKMLAQPLATEGPFVLDHRPGARRVLEPAWQPRSGGKSLRFEVADTDDLQLVTQAWTMHLNHYGNIFQRLDTSYEEVAPFLFERTAGLLGKGMSVLAFEDNRLVAYNLLNVVGKNDIEDTFGPRMLEEGKKPRFDYEMNYARKIERAPFPSHKTRQIYAYLMELLRQTGKFLPSEVHKVAFLEGIGVNPCLSRSSLAPALLQHGHNLARKAGCQLAVSYCVSTGAQKIFIQDQWKPVFSFPYERFLEDGELIFDQLPDRATTTHCVFKKL